MSILSVNSLAICPVDITRRVLESYVRGATGMVEAEGERPINSRIAWLTSKD